MFKKSIVPLVSAAILAASPGRFTLTAAAQTMRRGPITGVSVTPAIGTGLNRPVPGASSFDRTRLTPDILTASSLPAAPNIAASAGAVPAAVQPQALSVTPAGANSAPVTANNSPLAVMDQDAKNGVVEKSAALNKLFDNSQVRDNANIEAHDTTFEDPRLVGPAVAKIKELFSKVGMWGSGQFKANAGPSESLASVHVSPTGKPQADRVTLDIGYNWYPTDGWASFYVTLIAGERPALLVQSKIEDVPFEPGAKIPKTGLIKRAGLSVNETSVMLRVETNDGSAKSYEIRLQPDGTVQYNEAYDNGIVRITLPKK